MRLVIADRFAAASAPADEVIELAFEQRERSRFRALLLSGEEIGVDLPRGSLIRHGDRLQLQDGRVVAVEAAPERLMEVRAVDEAGLARLAYHIGNRHVPLQVGNGWLRLLPDHVLRAMIEGLGGRVGEVETGFQPESGAYGHSHVHHQHDDQGHGGRIHAFDPRTEGQGGGGGHPPAAGHHEHSHHHHHHHPVEGHDEQAHR
jgi:urease accessory protein